MYLTDPVAALRRAASRVRAGGLVCVHEADLDNLCAAPLTPLWAQVHELEKAGVATQCRVVSGLVGVSRIYGGVSRA
jgi:hypothetical protein